MLNPIIVMVTFDPFTNTVSIDNTLIELGDRESIEWQFTGLASDQLGCIRFLAPSPPLGPFQTLAFQTDFAMGNNVVGMGNNGAPGHYHYKAMVLTVPETEEPQEPEEPATFSGVAIVDNRSGTKDLSPDVIVAFDQEQGRLTVTPHELKLESGRTATWHIFGVPGDHFVTFHFEGFPDPLTGPFSSFFLSSAMGFLARGENFSDALRTTGSLGDPIQYFIRVRNANGQVLAVHDPLIDTLGDPPP